MKKKYNIIECTEKLIEIVNNETLTADTVVSISFVYRTGKDKEKIIGLNVQAYGHKLFIVPDINDMSTYHKYVTRIEGYSNEVCRKTIIDNLIENEGYSKTDAAKLMKCSVNTVNRLLEISIV